ncbi:thiolase [Tilletiaria anomala UBC 951]|uniref:acetyl-CoA C-acyltransferase n=1 Tax=Tilletiaria anomala (strain ATCC 24038 / CBS 436.72 / UBC 951) TaxID=1037660 RepID=A0A066VR45_TILAU|nr:thiolase [Tilletiaria anomala UBC 951]KDN41055.1 thiolase [Tilletiaria anomala UBC 951]
MASRIGQLASHLNPATWNDKGLAAAKLKHDDDVVIVAAGRTPFCKAFKGELKDTSFSYLMLEMFKGIIAKADVDPSIIEDIVVGNVRNADSSYEVRAAALAAGIPHTSPTLIVNRFCSSGLMAIRTVANQIQAGEINCGLAVGAEAMTSHSKHEWAFDEDVTSINQEATDCVMPMGWTSENVAKDFNISRRAMDEFAARSHQRAAAAQKAGKFDAEIMPINVPANSEKGPGKRQYKIVSADDGIRPNSSVDSLGKVRAAFPQWEPSNTTGGNASQITDGAAAVLLMRRSYAKQLGKKILGKYVSCAVSGLEPRIMGIGPSLAIPKVLEQTGIKLEEVELFEINEAFASMAVYCVEKLGLDIEKVNVNGGACALGHPLGATGARLVVTALAELERRKQHVAVVSMCIGLGMGAACVILRED